MLHIRQRNTQGCTSKFVSLNEIENLLTKLQRWLPALPPLSKWFLYSFINVKKNKNNNIFLRIVNVKINQWQRRTHNKDFSFFNESLALSPTSYFGKIKSTVFFPRFKLNTIIRLLNTIFSKNARWIQGCCKGKNDSYSLIISNWSRYHADMIHGMTI